MLLILLILTFPLFADWNQDFDRETALLIEEIPFFQSKEYLKEKKTFTHLFEQLLKDASVKRQIAQAPAQEKKMIFDHDRGIVIKKRRNNHIFDLFVWELSFLLGTSEFVVPSYPLDIAGKRVIVQKLENFKHGDGEGHYPDNLLEKVSLETYWKAHFQAYLLGLSDMAAGNIGINPHGKIRFFDNEASLTYYNVPFKTEKSFSTGFICHSFDWPQFSQPLDASTAKALQAFVASLADFETHYPTYLSHRPLNEQGIFFRLEKVRQFEIKKGTTFNDFFNFVFPKLGSGMPELNHLVSTLLHTKARHGTSLFYVCRKMLKNPPEAKKRALIEAWINKYVD